MDLIFKLLAVDGAASPACACGVARLEHEVRDDAVEDHIAVVATLSETCEILASLKVVESVIG